MSKRGEAQLDRVIRNIINSKRKKKIDYPHFYQCYKCGEKFRLKSNFRNHKKCQFASIFRSYYQKI